MIKITRKKNQNTVQANELKTGDTFLYNKNLYLVIEDGKRKFLNLDTGHVDPGLPLFANVPLVDCTLSYQII